MKSFVFIFLFLFVTSFAQDYGVIYSATKANELYGGVDKSIQISKTIFESTLDSSERIVMFQFVGNECYIFDNSENVLLGSNQSIVKPQQFYVFSINKIEDLLRLGKSEIIYLELRGEVFTITYGEFTLEDAWGCPPFCN